MNETRPYRFSTFTTPLGPFSVAVDPEGAVAAAVFGARTALLARLKGALLVGDRAATATARRQLSEWFRGGRRGFSLRLAPAGTKFQRRVWRALAGIPYGQTRSYGEVSRALGSSPRAVGRANATNPVCVIVPCHRVVGSDGALTGYAFGERRKRGLLRLERRAAVSLSGPSARRRRRP